MVFYLLLVPRRIGLKGKDIFSLSIKDVVKSTWVNAWLIRMVAIAHKIRYFLVASRRERGMAQGAGIRWPSILTYR